MHALLVVTPGFDVTAFLPLRRALEREGVQVSVVAFEARGQTSVDYAAEIRAAVAARAGSPDAPEHLVLVAHGFGGTLSLLADPPGLERMVLLAPVLSVVPQDLVADLAAVPIPAAPRGGAVDLSRAHLWSGSDVATVLLGEPRPALVPVSAPFVAEVQGWIRDAHVPLDLAHVDTPVWIAVGLADEIATVEATVPASRALPHRTLVRLGANRFDPHDDTHADMLMSEVPVRVAAREAAR